MRNGVRFHALGAFCLLAVAACGPQPKPSFITEAKAKQLTVDRYRQLFSDKYLLNRADGKYYPFPSLDVDAITHIESRPDAFLVRAEPPAGVAIEARVDKSGQWTELVRVTVSTE